MKVDYQVNKITTKDKIIFRLDRIEFGKHRIMAQPVFTGTESQCLKKLSEIK